LRTYDIADVKHKRFDKSALTQHVFNLGHSMDWQQSKVWNLNVIIINAVS